MLRKCLRLALDRGVFFEHVGLRGREDAVESAQHRERQDDLAVFVSLIGATEQVADAPDEVRRVANEFQRSLVGDVSRRFFK